MEDSAQLYDDEFSDDETSLLKPALTRAETVPVHDSVKPEHGQWNKAAPLATPTFEETVIDIESDEDIAMDLGFGLLLERPTEITHGFDLQETRKLKEFQDVAYQESLLRDQAKAQEEQSQAILYSLKILEQEQLQQARLLRVPNEPPLSVEDAVLIKVRHLTKGIEKKRFHKSNKMSSVYDWIGSLSPVPMHFALFDYSGSVCSPQKCVQDFQRCTLNMRETDSSPPLQDDNEVNFKGFGINYDGKNDTLSNSDIIEDETDQENVIQGIPRYICYMFSKYDISTWFSHLYLIPK